MRVTMKAVDTLHLSTVGPDNILPGGTFEVGETDAKSLEDRGLAKRVGTAKASDDKPAEKATVSAASMRKGK